MMHVDIIAGDRAAFPARSQCHRGHHAGGQSNRAQGAHGVDQDTEDRFFQPKGHDDIFIGGMDD